MSSDSSTPTAKPPRRRRMTPKVRTGCLTCRQRHVKCDEAKPVCQRCFNLQKQCVGLGYSQNKEVSPATSADPSLGRDFIGYLEPSIALPCSDMEYRYFHLFESHCAADLTGYFESNFWNKLILQESHIEDSIRNAVIAIGALYKAVEISQINQPDSVPNSAHLQHLSVALRHYQKALNTQREALQHGKPSLKAILMSCLLFIIFECFQGDLGPAMLQILCGCHLIKQLMPCPRADQSSCRGQSGNHENNDPLRQLCRIFARLETQVIIYDFARLRRHNIAHVTRKILPSVDQSTEVFSFKPFDTLERARYSWDLLMPKLMEAHQEASSYKYSRPEDIPSEILKSIQKQLDVMHSWGAAFEPVFKRAHREGNEQHRPGASIIKIDYLAARIKLYTVLEPLEIAYDRFLPEFQEVLSLATYILHQERPSFLKNTIFMLDSAVAYPLFFITTKCRTRDVRWGAIELLKSPARRECFWDAPSGAKIGAWLASIEEAGVAPEQIIPECNRLRLYDTAFDLRKRVGWIRAGKRWTGATEYSSVIKATFTW